MNAGDWESSITPETWASWEPDAFDAGFKRGRESLEQELAELRGIVGDLAALTIEQQIDNPARVSKLVRRARAYQSAHTARGDE